MKVLKKIRDGYIIWHANRIPIPVFPKDIMIRKNVKFSGRVQNVGFRFEIYCIAEKLNLVGWVKNLEDGTVEAEFQGEESKIDFLVDCMKSLKRASVKKVKTIVVPTIENSKDFFIIK